MLPIVEVPATICQALAPYRGVFCRDAGLAHVSRYITGLILSPTKTLPGMYDLQGWRGACAPSRRAMHEAGFEAAWAADALMPRPCTGVAPDHRGRGREGLCLNWT